LTVTAATSLLAFASAARGPAPASPSVEARAQLPGVDSHLLGWLAPGATGTVAGFAGSYQRIQLQTTGGTVISRTRCGRLGRFLFRFRAPAPGRYRLRVVAGHADVPAGVLTVRPLVLEAVGDITFGEQVGPAIAAHGAAYPWLRVAGLLRSADVTVGNLETAVSSRGAPQGKEFTFRGPPQALRPLAQLAGFDALTLANNHSADFGRDALLDTARHVRAAGIEPFGAGANLAAARSPALVEAGGLKVALLGYSDVNPAGFNASASTPGTSKADVPSVFSDVRAAARRADVVICFMHWGMEMRPEPDLRQQQLAAACLNAGARVVLGAHPHVLGPVRMPGRRSLIAWTLGNFVFPSSRATARSAILQIHLAADGVRGFRLLPIVINGFRPEPLRR
jgi:poly-gamma-glutamate capsule biosynthesis protein CapA/YwtB (metallophosphatase superfamily)